MTTISHRGTVRTTNILRALYLKYCRSHRITSKWYRPRFFIFGYTVYQVRYVLVPAHRVAAYA